VHPNSDFEQPGTFWRTVLSAGERTNLVGNLVDHMRNARRDIQARMIDIAGKVDRDFAARLADGLRKYNSAL